MTTKTIMPVDPSIWATLGLDPPQTPAEIDPRSVKRAYATRLKAIDQAADPDGFQALRAAYEAAQQVVSGNTSAAGSPARPGPAPDVVYQGVPLPEDTAPDGRSEADAAADEELAYYTLSEHLDQVFPSGDSAAWADFLAELDGYGTDLRQDVEALLARRLVQRLDHTAKKAPTLPDYITPDIVDHLDQAFHWMRDSARIADLARKDGPALVLALNTLRGRSAQISKSFAGPIPWYLISGGLIAFYVAFRLITT